MKKMTEDNLKGALAGESQAHVKYAAFAEKAEQEKFANIARLFRASSFPSRSTPPIIYGLSVRSARPGTIWLPPSVGKLSKSRKCTTPIWPSPRSREKNKRI